MEYCDGGDLCAIVKVHKMVVIEQHENLALSLNFHTDPQKEAKKKLFAESKILNYFVQMALGLHYMHR